MHNPLHPTHTLSLSHSPSKSCRMKSGVSCRMPLSTYCRNKLHTQSLPDWKPLSSWLQHNQTWHSHQRLGTTSLLVTTQSNMTQPPEAMNHLPLGYDHRWHSHQRLWTTSLLVTTQTWHSHQRLWTTSLLVTTQTWHSHQRLWTTSLLVTTQSNMTQPPGAMNHFPLGYNTIKRDTATRGYEPPPSWLRHNQTWHSHQGLWTTSLLVTTQSNMTQPPEAMNHLPLGYNTIKHDTATRGYEPTPSWLRHKHDTATRGYEPPPSWLRHNQTWHSHQGLWTTSLLVTTQSNMTQPPEAMNHLPLGYNTIKHDTATRGYEPPPSWLQHNQTWHSHQRLGTTSRLVTTQ